MTAEERWVDIPGYGGHYRISDLGEVLSVERRARTCNQWGEASRTVPERILSQRIRDGRALVQLCIDGLRHNVTVSTTVLDAFAGPRPRGHYAEFHNGDPTDCRLSNLYWRKRDWGGRGRKLKAFNDEETAS